ncbi:GNAT family N-acetyltransferase [Gemmobacter sp.]|uniref:GNAT family N-acetyltransferase n=1 Tax=Gemmobacter sp. TaxID=1898957 RepID=UPI002AFF2772|nr:GNAT family N-acetyltransferase [Gemmobacter sp.]
MTLTIRPITAADDFPALLDLIRRAFAYMDGVIDPPSSAHRLTVDSLRQKAAEETGLVAFDGDRLVGCAFLRPEPGGMYLGKVAVDPQVQTRGIGGALLAAAEGVARAQGAPRLRLETRVELVRNHATFAAWGFRKSGESRHPGFDRTTTIEMTKPLM